MKKGPCCASILLTISFFIFGCGGSKTSIMSQPPMPPGQNLLDDIPSDCPVEIRAFAGIRSGRFEENYGLLDSSNGINVTLSVTPFKENGKWKATVIHCWGDSPEWNVKKGYATRKGDFKYRDGDGKLVLVFQNKRVVWTLEKKDDGLKLTHLSKGSARHYQVLLK
jgi:hypothetical protein